jgi:DNA-binding beta-propeller fold protein YncE
VDAAAMQVLRSFALGGTPQGVAVSRDGTRVVVANEAIHSTTGWVQDVDLTAGTWTTPRVSQHVFGIVDAPRLRRVFIIAPDDGTLLRYDLSTRALSPPLDLTVEPRRGAIHWPTRTLIVTDNDGGNVAFLEP